MSIFNKKTSHDLSAITRQMLAFGKKKIDQASQFVTSILDALPNEEKSSPMRAESYDFSYLNQPSRQTFIDNFVKANNPQTVMGKRLLEEQAAALYSLAQKSKKAT